MTSPFEAGRLLDQLDVVKHPCDLDLLVFFARHPRTLLSSDQIAAFLGYEVKAVAGSLELLLESGFVSRTPHRRHVARMFVLAVGAPSDGWLPALTRLATTREGRLALLSELQRRSAAAGDPPQRGHGPDAAATPPLRFPQGRNGVTDASSQGSSIATSASGDSRKTNTRGSVR